MDDSKVGRVPFFVLIAFTVFVLISLIYTYLFVTDTDAAYKMAGPGPLETGNWIALSFLLCWCLWNSVLIKGVWRTVAAAGITIFICWLAEGLGVHYGYVFGHYHYTDLLGVQIWAVPIVVCFAWEPILYSAYYLTDFLLPMKLKESSSLIHKVLASLIAATIGGMAVTAWDLMIDPYMVQRGCWVWEQGGAYMQGIVANGGPMSNYFGWWKVAFVCLIVFRLTMGGGKRPQKRSLYLTVYGPMLVYFVLFIGDFFSCFFYLKRPEVSMVGLLSMGLFLSMGLAKIYLLKTEAGHSAAEDLLRQKAQPPAK
jgi:uncharacterized membrane protein